MLLTLAMKVSVSDLDDTRETSMFDNNNYK